MTDFGLAKDKHLKHKKDIDKLFKNGEYLFKHPIAIVYSRTPAINERIDSPLFKVGFSVSKRLFKRAVDRNRIKRLMREALRTNQQLLRLNREEELHFMMIYKGKTIENYSSIRLSCIDLIQKI